MMRLEVRNSCKDFNSYRAARVKSLFNAESGAEFKPRRRVGHRRPRTGQLGVIVGPSGSGKSSLGRMIFGPCAFYFARGLADRQTNRGRHRT